MYFFIFRIYSFILSTFSTYFFMFFTSYSFIFQHIPSYFPRIPSWGLVTDFQQEISQKFFQVPKKSGGGGCVRKLQFYPPGIMGHFPEYDVIREEGKLGEGSVRNFWILYTVQTERKDMKHVKTFRGSCSGIKSCGRPACLIEFCSQQFFNPSNE